METHVPWKRLWRQLDVETRDDPLPGGGGFHQTSQDLLGFRSSDDPKPTDELLDFQCLVLCGEPGMGKTTVLDLARQRIAIEAAAAGAAYWRSFRYVYGPETLLRELTSSDEWVDWTVRGRSLTIVIDGVDEGLALSLNVVSGLLSEVRNKPLDRLRLILTCRDAEWPEAEGRELMALWPPKRVGRFQLQRLRAEDAEQAARHWGLTESETAAFMSEVHAKAVEDFAARPITLRMLVEEFKAGRGLPSTRIEMFRRACARLSREDSDRTRLLRRSRRYTFGETELIPVAKRIAAWMILGQYTAVSTLPPEKRPSTAIDLERFLSPDGAPEEREKLEVTLSTALFRNAGPEAWTLATQVYTEFLASGYLSDLTLDQVLDLLCIPEGSELRVVPQLAELAGWLAMQHPQFLEWLIAHEPETLLRNDASCLPEPQRELIVQVILDRMTREEVFDDWNLRRFYGSFRHAGLGAQLRPYLRDKSAGRIARRAAIDLADLGRVAELFDDLLSIAKNMTEETTIREEALSAASHLASVDRLNEFEAFARAEVGPDPSNTLRGIALEALVPDHWSVSKALPAVRLPHNAGYLGAFLTSCRSHIPKSIAIHDLPDLLNELARLQNPSWAFDERTHDIGVRALILAARNPDTSEIVESLIRVMRSIVLEEHWMPLSDEPHWMEGVANEPEVRRRLMVVTVECAGVNTAELRRFVQAELLPSSPDDCAWVIDQLRSAPVPLRTSWAVLAARHCPTIADTAESELFLDACSDSLELAAEVGWPWHVRLDSETARLWRKDQMRHRAMRELVELEHAEPTADELFAAELKATEADALRWPKLAIELQRPLRGPSGFSYSPDPTDWERWEACSKQDRDRVLDCARHYLLTAPSSIEPGKAEPNHQAAVFWAIYLLRDRLSSDQPLRFAVLGNWFEVMFIHPFKRGPERQEIARCAVAMDPDRAASIVQRQFAEGVRDEPGVFEMFDTLGLPWRAEFTSTLLDLLTDESIDDRCFSCTLEFIACHDANSGCSWLAERLMLPATAHAARDAAMGLALFPERLWSELTARLRADNALATATLQALADFHESSSHRPLEKLTPEHLVELFLLLGAAFPDSRPFTLPPADVPARTRIENIRHFVPDRLEALASREACDALLRLSGHVPHWRTQMKRRWRDVRIALLRKQWTGVPIEIIAAMAGKRERRWVRSTDDLHDLVIDSLRRFQKNLNEVAHPIVRRLWNESAKKTPKPESALTQEIALWLRDDLGGKNGAALGCNVEPSLICETDIEVRATPGGPVPAGQPFVVTIEVKRDFNSEVATGLEQQLVGEYLLKLSRTHGIYVVGWYGLGSWRKRNPLKARSYEDLQDAVRELVARSQAAHPTLKLAAVCLNCEFPTAFRKRK